MPSVDHCLNKPTDMTTLTNSLEVFDTYKHREEKDSDEESFHLPLDDDDTENKYQDHPVKNGNENDTEDEILNKFESAGTNVEQPIDSQLEDKLLNDDEEEKEKIKMNVVNDKNKDYTNQNGFCEEEKLQNETENIRKKETPTMKSTKQCKKFEDVTKDHNVPKLDIDKTSDHNNTSEMQFSTKQKKNKTLAECNNDNNEEEKIKNIESEVKQCNDVTTTLEESMEDDKIGDKCDNSSPKDSSEDAEDLFDISIIRDAEEDAENAFKEAQSDQNAAEENDDDSEERNDDKVEDESSNDKVENIEMDEVDIEVDKTDDNLKSDDVDIEENNLKLDSDNASETTKDIGCVVNSENNENADEAVIHHDEQVQDTRKSVNSATKNSKIDVNKSTNQNLSQINHEVVENNSSEENNGAKRKITASEPMDQDKKVCENRRSLKRTLDATEQEFNEVLKKSRTEEEPLLPHTPPQTENEVITKDKKIKEEETPKEKLPLKSLLSLSEFIKNRKNNRRLTLQDIEEFCVQKICEVIVHKSDLGDVHHQLKLQEQLIDSMRKEIVQLTKQTRDLEIVNKKLLFDLKQLNATQKPLNPLKITRSVGLQVKFTQANDTLMKRIRAMQKGTPVTVATPSKGPRNIPSATTPSPHKQISPQKPQHPIVNKTTPILSQALQPRKNIDAGVTSRTAQQHSQQQQQPQQQQQQQSQVQQIRTKSISEVNKSSQSGSVIDLTDEDDKSDKNKPVSKMIPTKNITVPLRTTPLRVNATAQGIRLTTPQGKGSPITSVVTSSTPQLMYVVQSAPQNVLTSALGQKALVVNFQSANGVTTSTLNGSAVSVIPTKQANTIQLKTVMPSGKSLNTNKMVKVAKHPAPLPPPPVVRVTTDKPLKPIPPKPHLSIKKTDTGIILQWRMPYELDMYEVIASYQLYAYQETSALPSTDMWRKVGDVKALALPMACTLTQFADKNKYYFAVRPVDIHKRIGVFSEPEEISL